MARRTEAEINEALASVRSAIRAAETSQRYKDGLMNEVERANLDILYKREDALLDERQQLQTGGASAGVAVVHGIPKRY